MKKFYIAIGPGLTLCQVWTGSKLFDTLFFLFDLILYVLSTIFQLCRYGFLGRTSTKLGSMCLAQGQNTVTPVRLEHATSVSSQAQYH